MPGGGPGDTIQPSGFLTPSPSSSGLSIGSAPRALSGTTAHRIGWDVQSPHPFNGHWRADGTVHLELDPDASYEHIAVYAVTAASITADGVFSETNSNTDLSCTTVVPATSFEYSNPLGPEHSSHPQGGGSITVDFAGLDAFGSTPAFPPGYYYGTAAFLIPVKGTTTCNIGGQTPYELEQLITVLEVRFPEWGGIYGWAAPPRPMTVDGRMSGSDVWERPGLFRGSPGQMMSAWDIQATGD